MGRIKDMTEGRPGKLILEFALPLMLGNMFQQLYTFVDTLVAGRALGMHALAALGVTEWITFLLFGFVQGVTQGFSVVIARCFGAQRAGMRRERLEAGEDGSCRQAVFMGACLCGGMAALFTVLGEMAVSPILFGLKTPQEIRGLSEAYLRILCGGIPISFCYNYLAAVLRALGDSKTPLQAMTASSVCNIVLDLIFVCVLGWGIRGAAAATVAAQAVAALLCFFQTTRLPWPASERGWRRINRRLLGDELRMGIPMGLQSCITAAGGLVVQAVVNGFGVVFLAGYTAANRIYGLLETAASSYGYAMASYAGQNQGAGNGKRIDEGLRVALQIGVVTAGLMSAIMVCFGKGILDCFLTGDPGTIRMAGEAGYRFLCVLALFFPLLYVLYIIRSCVQGMGNAFWPMLSSMVQLFMRVSCAVGLTTLIGDWGLYCAEVLAWMGADMLLAVVYQKMKKD